MEARAVITGIGLVTSVGSGASAYWRSLTEGRSGIGPISSFDTTGYRTRIGGEIRDVDVNACVPPDQRRRTSWASKMAVAAAKMALADSGLDINDRNRDNIDVLLGVACPDLETLARSALRRERLGERGASPLMPSIVVTAGPTGNVSQALQVHGEATTISTACSSGLNAIGHALRHIQSGASQIIFAGGADAGLQPDLVASFDNAGVLSRRNEEPCRASRPFDAGRDGHVLSDGAGILVIEEYIHASARGADIYAEVVGYGTTSDAMSMADVSEDSRNAAHCLRKALRDAGRNPEDVDAYVAHGSAARITDRRETRMLKEALGDDAYRVPVSAIKSMTGHCFGASGALQTAACALAVRHNTLPPTINYEQRDPDCDLDYVPNCARDHRVDAALTYSLGMGNNAALALAAA